VGIKGKGAGKREHEEGWGRGRRNQGQNVGFAQTAETYLTEAGG